MRNQCLCLLFFVDNEEIKNSLFPLKKRKKKAILVTCLSLVGSEKLEKGVVRQKSV